MKKVVRLLLMALATAFAVLADKTPPTQHKHVMSCCYCACQMEDIKGCHKLCALPDGEGGRKRAFTKTEDQLCTELCAIKREGCAHLTH